MAAPRKRTSKTAPPPPAPPPKRKRASFVFWTLFFIVIISLFFLNLQLIRSSLENVGILDKLFNQTDVVEDREGARFAPPTFSFSDMGLKRAPEPIPLALEPSVQFADPLPRAVDDPASIDESALAAEPPTEAPGQGAPIAAAPEPAPVAAIPPAAAQSRDRSLYFIRVDGDGAILRARVTRPSAATDSPLSDSLRLLLQGPSAEERRQGLISLIPKGTEFQSAQVRGSTAYLSFSEDFQFNTYGVEGYVGQLRQIIWTATEFPNVNDVQILIEGHRIDFLGESISIGSPLGRSSF